MMAFWMLSVVNLSSVKAAIPENPEMKVKVETMDAATFLALTNRVGEIKAMDFSGMTMAEKKAVRKELKSLKSELKAVTGVYISAGALIVIIILLLLLL